MATVAVPRLAARGVPTARRALGRVALAAVLANSTWFSATAIVPALRHDWGLSAGGAAWLAVAVHAGFITANVALVPAGGFAAALPSRFLVGVALAGVYAPGVRLVATHYERGRGVATGVVVGASRWAPPRRISCVAWATSRGRRRSSRPPPSRCSRRRRSAR